jgi:transporter family protein
MAAIVLLLWYPTRKKTTPFKWRTSILFISLFLGVADFCYFSALAEQGALIAVVSMIRRGSVLVSFAFGAMVLREKNLKSKVFDLLLILIGLFFLYLGSK